LGKDERRGQTAELKQEIPVVETKAAVRSFRPFKIPICFVIWISCPSFRRDSGGAVGLHRIRLRLRPRLGPARRPGFQRWDKLHAPAWRLVPVSARHPAVSLRSAPRRLRGQFRLEQQPDLHGRLAAGGPERLPGEGLGMEVGGPGERGAGGLHAPESREGEGLALDIQPVLWQLPHHENADSGRSHAGRVPAPAGKRFLIRSYNGNNGSSAEFVWIL
jgi:hypothetical protein